MNAQGDVSSTASAPNPDSAAHQAVVKPALGRSLAEQSKGFDRLFWAAITEKEN